MQRASSSTVFIVGGFRSASSFPASVLGSGLAAATHKPRQNTKDKAVVSDRPILAVDGEQILFAFDNVEDATGFLLKEATDTATIFRHNGRDWDKMDRPDPQP